MGAVIPVSRMMVMAIAVMARAMANGQSHTHGYYFYTLWPTHQSVWAFPKHSMEWPETPPWRFALGTLALQCTKKVLALSVLTPLCIELRRGDGRLILSHFRQSQTSEWLQLEILKSLIFSNFSPDIWETSKNESGSNFLSSDVDGMPNRPLGLIL